MFKKVLLVTVLFFSFVTTANASANTLHEVKKGDTLTKIAKTYKVTVNDLRTWNKLTKDNIYLKQKLVVKKPVSVVAAAKPVAKPTIPTKTEVVVPKNEVKAEQVVNVVNPLDEAKALSEDGQAVYRLVQEMAPLLAGIPYLYAGNTIAGFDCSGFIHYVHTQAGLTITRQSSESYFTQSAPVSTPVIGDLVFFENTYKEGISHMGIYIGNDEFIHAGSKGVEIAKLSNVYWKEHFVSFKRFHAVSVN
ncbi:C40 family peptidase [Bacillus sp. FJAT-22090]|uniref:C40 family peptidase n=1 Tax=Bacillus sp. FJAT-22090 TaxID=1581038 RepID=UPI0011A83E9C|nr:C40 family peptidase [Bacillus sp. FJAT-22090]